MSNTDELKQLRDQIMATVVPLVVDSETGEDRFDILLRIIQSGGASADIFRKAYDSAQKIEDADERLDAMLSLVDELDYRIQSIDVGQGAQTPEASNNEGGPENSENQG